MALTISRSGPDGTAPVVPGNFKVSVADITFDSSYPTGGYSILPTDLGFTSVIYGVICIGANGGFYANWRQDTQKLWCLQNAAGAGGFAEVGAATNLSAFSGRLIAFGT